VTNPGRPRIAVGVAACVVLLGPARPLASQGVEALAARCSGSNPSLQIRCTDAALAARVVQQRVGLLAGLGAEVAGSASTLGRMLGTRPRLSVSLRGALAVGHLPDPGDRQDGTARGSTVIPALHAGLSLGIFDGFHPVPTAAGFLSVDLVAGTSIILLPTTSGFPERSHAVSWGVRVGVLRESFTLPGVSFSATRRSVAPVVLGSLAGGDAFEVSVDPSVTSLRATVGKDVYRVGIMGGVGWDSYGGNATARSAESEGTVDDFGNRRMLYFGGASYNLLALQVSAEAGWAPGFARPSTPVAASFDPTRCAYFAGLALRLTL